MDFGRGSLGGIHSNGYANKKEYHGLINQGATCYLNSTLQVLFMTNDFREALDRQKEGDIDITLKSLFEKLRTGVADPRDITAKLGIENVCEQRDAAEYFERILSLVNPKVSKIFKGCLKHITRCSVGHEKIDEGRFWTLPLPLDKQLNNSVSDSLTRFFAKTHFTKDNRIYCDECDGKVDATNECKMEHHPEFLTLLLKRFEFDYGRMAYVKNHCKVDIALTLQTEDHKYVLYAAVNHSGSLSCGHYTATINSFEDQSWYVFDDRLVHKDEEPFSERSRTAYLLIYKKVTEKQEVRMKDPLKRKREQEENEQHGKKERLCGEVEIGKEGNKDTEKEVDDGGKLEAGNVNDGGRIEAGNIDDGGRIEAGNIDDGGRIEAGTLVDGERLKVGNVDDGGKLERKQTGDVARVKEVDDKNKEMEREVGEDEETGVSDEDEEIEGAVRDGQKEKGGIVHVAVREGMVGNGQKGKEIRVDVEGGEEAGIRKEEKDKEISRQKETENEVGDGEGVKEGAVHDEKHEKKIEVQDGKWEEEEEIRNRDRENNKKDGNQGMDREMCDEGRENDVDVGTAVERGDKRKHYVGSEGREHIKIEVGDREVDRRRVLCKVGEGEKYKVGDRREDIQRSPLMEKDVGSRGVRNQYASGGLGNEPEQGGEPERETDNYNTRKHDKETMMTKVRQKDYKEKPLLKGRTTKTRREKDSENDHIMAAQDEVVPDVQESSKMSQKVGEGCGDRTSSYNFNTKEQDIETRGAHQAKGKKKLKHPTGCFSILNCTKIPQKKEKASKHDENKSRRRFWRLGRGKKRTEVESII